MLLAEVNNPSGLRLTKSNTDGIFLHFDAGGENQVGIRLDNPELVGYLVVLLWAEQQFSLHAESKLSEAQSENKEYKELLDGTLKKLKHSQCPHAIAAKDCINEAIAKVEIEPEPVKG